MLTPCARKGIYRYWPGWVPANADANLSLPAILCHRRARASVRPDGTPLAAERLMPIGTPYTDCAWGNCCGVALWERVWPAFPYCAGSIYSQTRTIVPITLSTIRTRTSSPLLNGAPWNALRGAYDTSGYIANFSSIMPLPNYYNDGDGLNQAALAWTRTTHGEDTVYGSGMDSARKSITVKIDHNLSEKHRLSGTYSYEKDGSDGENEPTWPTIAGTDTVGYGGFIDRRPQTFTGTLTSTLRPTLPQRISRRAGVQQEPNQRCPGKPENRRRGEGLSDAGYSRLGRLITLERTACFNSSGKRHFGFDPL